jgi:hypothetical protein
MGGSLHDFAGWSDYASIAALSINPGIDVMAKAAVGAVSADAKAN